MHIDGHSISRKIKRSDNLEYRRSNKSVKHNELTVVRLPDLILTRHWLTVPACQDLE
jgi:hypothetical protein